MPKNAPINTLAVWNAEASMSIHKNGTKQEHNASMTTTKKSLAKMSFQPGSVENVIDKKKRLPPFPVHHDSYFYCFLHILLRFMQLKSCLLTIII